MATFTTLPALVLPGHEIQLIFTPGDVDGNFVKVWCTGAPRGSKLRQQLDGSQSERVLVISETDITRRPAYTFDKSGTYNLEIEEFKKGVESYGGRYKGDPDSYLSPDRKLLTPQNVSVATLLECEVGVSPDTAVLQLYVSGVSVNETTAAVHGVTTPQLIKPSSDKAKAAADSTDVVSALDSLGGTSTALATSDIGDLITSWIDTYNGHIQDATVHFVADTANTIDDSFRNPETPKAVQRSLAECLKKYLQHITNVDPSVSPPDPGTGTWHWEGSLGANGLADWVNYPIAQGGSSVTSNTILSIDLLRCLTDHMAWTDGHAFADTRTVTGGTGYVQILHRAFLAYLALSEPTAPANENAGKVTLASLLGFKEAT